MSDAPKIKLTGKVRRGLELMRRIMVEAGEPGGDGTPVHWALRNLGARETSDYNQAMAWIEQNGRPAAAPETQPADAPLVGAGDNQEKADG